jgi:hypothetical protein
MFGCGRKAPPFLPKQDFPFTVMQLQVETETGDIALKGLITATRDRRINTDEVKGCRVYHAWYTPDDCPGEGCPISYSVYRDIEGQVITEDGFYCRVSMDAEKGIHFFKVSLIGRNSTIGPPSNQAKLVIGD